jgi:hypothetical protein
METRKWKLENGNWKMETGNSELIFPLSEQESVIRDAGTSARDQSNRAVESERFTRRRLGEGNQPILLADDE